MSNYRHLKPGFFARLGRKLDQYIARKKVARRDPLRNAWFVVRSREASRQSGLLTYLPPEEQARQRDRLEKSGIKRVLSLTPRIRIK